MSKLTTFVAGAGFGAGVMYLLDPRAGSDRRTMARERAGQVAHSGPVQTVAQTAGAQAQGVVAKAKSAATGGDSAPGDDNTLKAKVETEIFRADDAPKGSVNVTVVNGIVELRGEVPDQSWHERLESDARNVTGVSDVRNLLHLPGETPVNVAGTPGVSGS